MEFEYSISNITTKKTIHYIIRHSIIIDVVGDSHNSEEFKFIGVDINKYLEMLYVWGQDIVITKITLVGLSDVVNTLAILEDILKDYLPIEKERTWIKLLYPDGHFGWIEYDGSEEDRLRIIKDHVELFGRSSNIDLSKATTKEYKKIIPKPQKNKFSFEL